MPQKRLFSFEMSVSVNTSRAQVVRMRLTSLDRSPLGTFFYAKRRSLVDRGPRNLLDHNNLNLSFAAAHSKTELLLHR